MSSRVVVTTAVGVGPLAMVEACADELDRQAGEVFSAADAENKPELDCAGEYARVLRRTARRLREAVRWTEDAVQAHLDGPCQEH